MIDCVRVTQTGAESPPAARWCRAALWGAALGVIGALGGCAETVAVRVTTFAQWPAQVEGTTFAVAASAAASGPAPAASQVAAVSTAVPATEGRMVEVSDLERRTYDASLATHLTRLGLKPAASDATARLVAQWELRRQRTMVPVTVPTYVPAYTVAWTRWDWDSAYLCDDRGWAGGRMCLVDRTVLQPVQHDTLTVHIADRGQQQAGHPAPQVFESRAEYEGAPASLPALMPLLMEAAFDRFPGVNGQVRVLRFDARTGVLQPSK